jgi:methionyl-tRNA formyltransferase
MNSPLTAGDLLEFRLDDSVEAVRWDELVAGSPNADVYHRAAYVRATAELEHSQPLGLMISLRSGRFLVPTLLRPISGADGQSWTDASTPYGYGGVLRLNPDSEVTLPDVVDFFQELQAWCAARKLVSCVIRSHPLLAQDWLLAQPPGTDFVKVVRRGNTVALSLQPWDDTRQCPPELSKGRRSDLALARRNLRITWNGSSDQNITLEQSQIFQALYKSTMQRVDAAEFFHFPPPYFERLAALGSDLHIAIAWHDGRPVGGAVFMAGPTYAHYHLSASDDTGRKYKASTLLVVEGANWARQRGCQAMHLGGGMHAGDPLMKFKRSFGGKDYEFGYVTLIADRERYQDMCSVPHTPWPYDQKAVSNVVPTPPNRPLRVILMGKDKPVVRRGLDYLLKHGYHVVAVVGPNSGPVTGKRLVDIVARRGVPTATDEQLYNVLAGRARPESLPFSLDDIDLVVSLLFWKRIRKPLIQLPKIGCINFHPAPLPEFRGVGGYNVAILENLPYWGAAVHFVDETFDTGDLIDVRRFDIAASQETAFSLEQKTQTLIFELFTATMDKVNCDRRLTGVPQGEGRYVSRADFERLRRIQTDDSGEIIARKIRAFWYPPNSGAAIAINGKEYTLIDENILHRLGNNGSSQTRLNSPDATGSSATPDHDVPLPRTGSG